MKAVKGQDLPGRVAAAPRRPAVKVGKPLAAPPSLSDLLGIGGPAPVARVVAARPVAARVVARPVAVRAVARPLGARTVALPAMDPDLDGPGPVDVKPCRGRNCAVPAARKRVVKKVPDEVGDY